MDNSCILFCFYIKPQLAHGDYWVGVGCILFCFYIKPQPVFIPNVCSTVVSYFVSTSNHNYGGSQYITLLVVSYFVSTSNHNLTNDINNLKAVVSYFVSTSNHNLCLVLAKSSIVVSYFVSTSNHNLIEQEKLTMELYLILFLHQTTTPVGC